MGGQRQPRAVRCMGFRAGSAWGRPQQASFQVGSVRLDPITAVDRIAGSARTFEKQVATYVLPGQLLGQSRRAPHLLWSGSLQSGVSVDPGTTASTCPAAGHSREALQIRYCRCSITAVI
jgi:hypothetical protein